MYGVEEAREEAVARFNVLAVARVLGPAIVLKLLPLAQLALQCFTKNYQWEARYYEGTRTSSYYPKAGRVGVCPCLITSMTLMTFPFLLSLPHQSYTSYSFLLPSR